MPQSGPPVWNEALTALRIPMLDRSAQRPSLPLDPGQGVLDPGRRPGSPRHSEELEPLLDEEVRVHPRRDEIHCGDAAVLRGGRRDFIERSLIEVALVVEWHPQLDRKIGRTDQQDVDARDRGDGIEVLQRLVRLDHRHDNELVIHGIHVIAVTLKFAPLAADPGVAAAAEGKIAAGAHGGLGLRAGVDHRHNDASCPGVKREADLIGLVRGDAHQRATCLPRIVWIDGCSCLISQAECWVSNSRKSYPASARIDTSTFGVTVVPTTVLPDLMESLMAFIWRRCLPQ